LPGVARRIDQQSAKPIDDRPTLTKTQLELVDAWRVPICQRARGYIRQPSLVSNV
jgi:hypothetical protein